MFHPKGKYVACEPIYDSDFYNPSSQLIKIPESAKERCDQGIVKYVGRDCDPEIQVGRHVIFSGYTGTNVGIDGEILIVIHSDFIKAIIDVEDYDVPGLYFIESQTGNKIQAKYTQIFPLLADAYKHRFGGIINIKKEEHPEQHDPYDERRR